MTVFVEKPLAKQETAAKRGNRYLLRLFTLVDINTIFITNHFTQSLYIDDLNKSTTNITVNL